MTHLKTPVGAYSLSVIITAEELIWKLFAALYWQQSPLSASCCVLYPCHALYPSQPAAAVVRGAESCAG